MFRCQMMRASCVDSSMGLVLSAVACGWEMALGLTRLLDSSSAAAPRRVIGAAIAKRQLYVCLSSIMSDRWPWEMWVLMCVLMASV